LKADHRLPRKNARSGSRSVLSKWLLPVTLLALLKVCYFMAFDPQTATLSIGSLFKPEVAAQEEEKKEAPQESAEQKAPDNATAQQEVGVDPQWTAELIAGIKEREAAMRIKEDDIRKQEERLQALKTDIEQRLELLSQIEKKITELIQSKKTMEDEKILKLAKVFEATPPEQAGPLLSKLDVDIAAQLLLKMQGRKAGRIWGFVDPEKAVEISKELARLNPNIDMNKMSQQ
jgi:flagellar motility protein MotE (MotC chaperone)